jgi:CheY-like chemotaxis protein
MLTAYPEKLQSRGHPVSGVDFFVAKPLEIEELRHAIARFTPAEA